MLKDIDTVEVTPYGFIFGLADVRRLFRDKRGLMLEIDTPRDALQIWITPTGKLRAFRRAELKEAQENA